MAETDTITRNAVQGLLELPVARKPLTAEFEVPSGYKVKVQALLDKLDALSFIERKRLYQGTWDRVEREKRLPTDNEMSRLRWKSRSHQFVFAPHPMYSAICMPSRNRLLGL